MVILDAQLTARHVFVGCPAGETASCLAWCDETLNAPRTVCMISPGNGPSLKLAERAGFRPYADGDYKGETITLLERRAA